MKLACQDQHGAEAMTKISIFSSLHYYDTVAIVQHILQIF